MKSMVPLTLAAVVSTMLITSAPLRAADTDSALHTEVATEDGVVTLTGVAKNDAEKSLVTKLATDINGVTSVINNVTVAVPVALN